MTLFCCRWKNIYLIIHLTKLSLVELGFVQLDICLIFMHLFSLINWFMFSQSSIGTRAYALHSFQFEFLSLEFLSLEFLFWISLFWISLFWISLFWISFPWISLSWIYFAWIYFAWISLSWISLSLGVFLFNSS